MRGQPISLGKIAPTSAGTPVPITTDRSIKASDVMFSPVEGNTGRVVLGVTNALNKTTLAGAISEFSQTSGKFNGPLILQDQTSQTCILLADYCVDADTNNEGLLVVYWVN